MLWQNKKNILAEDLVVVELSRYSQDYKEEYKLFPLQRPFTILRYVGDGVFKNLEGTETYRLYSNEKFNMDDIYVSDFFLLLSGELEYSVSLWDIKKLQLELEKIESPSELDKHKVRKIRL